MSMDQGHWDLAADVVVIGFGGAGAAAAIEAADQGAEVLVVDRFGGGGATAMSGGVVYLGGGTELQRAAGFDDSPEQMLSYLRGEAGDAVSEEALAAFCAQSADNFRWLTTGFFRPQFFYRYGFTVEHRYAGLVRPIQPESGEA